MHVAELWRFPVKSLRGERLDRARLTVDGVDGDRLVHVRSGGGVVTGRTRHALLGLPTATAADGTALIAGVPWDDPRALAIVRRAAGPDASLAAYAGRERFDILPLL